MAMIGHTEIGTTVELHQTLTTLPVGTPSYYLLQRPEKLTDWQEGRPDLDGLQGFSAGRLFGVDGEVRWKRRGEGFSLLWLSEGELPPGFSPLGSWTAEERHRVYLIGRGDRRIPRPLRYPTAGQSPQVEVISYRDETTQAIRFTRFRRFVEGGR